MHEDPPTPDLSSDDLHDVTRVTTAANEFESIAIIDALEEAGIPAMKQGGLVHFGQLAPSDILVPRKLIEQAKTAIAQLRGEASERGVSDAFKAENIEDQSRDAEKDPLVAQLLALSAEPKEYCLEELQEPVANWITDGVSASEMSRHLAMAGLSREEAEKLVAKVKSERTDLLRKSLRRAFWRGVGISLLGLCLICVPIPLQMAAVICVFMIGAFLAANANSQLNALGPEEIKVPDAELIAERLEQLSRSIEER